MLLLGAYEHTVDQKGRLRIPADFKEKMGKTKMVLCYGTNGSLAIHPEEALTEIFEKLGQAKVTESSDTKGLRLWAASMRQIEEDNQGRFSLPAQHRKFAGIEKLVYFVGMGRRIEIWAKEKWDAYNAAAEDDGANFDLEFNKLSERGI